MVARSTVVIVTVAMAAFEVPHPIGLLLHSSLGFPRRTVPCEHIRRGVRVVEGMGWIEPVVDEPSLVDQLAEACRTILYQIRVNFKRIKCWHVKRNVTAAFPQ